MEPTKLDQDKNRWDLLPIREVEQGVEVLTAGAVKYADNNWQKVVMQPATAEQASGVDRYYGALQRHLAAWRKGEKLDPENGTHLAHALCCILFLMWMDNRCTS